MRPSGAETNIIHMKAARLQFVLKEIAVRKEAVYRIASEKQASFMRRQEAEEARKKKEHRKEDECVPASYPLPPTPTTHTRSHIRVHCHCPSR